MLAAVATNITFDVSEFIPLAVGFFGLGTGYLIYGPEELFKLPGRSRTVDITTGLWGIWMPGFMQFLTGVYLVVGLTWFQVFTEKPLYMAGLAFTAYGVHWFVLGYKRYIGAHNGSDAFMSIAFLMLSLLGVLVFAKAHDYPVVILFVGLSLVYATEMPLRFGVFPAGERLVGLWHFLTGGWLLYLAAGTVVKIALDYNWLF